MFGIGLGFPIVLWLLMKCSASAIPLMEVMSIYGYSYLIFIPALILCTIPSNVESLADYYYRLRNGS